MGRKSRKTSFVESHFFLEKSGTLQLGLLGLRKVGAIFSLVVGEIAPPKVVLFVVQGAVHFSPPRDPTEPYLKKKLPQELATDYEFLVGENFLRHGFLISFSSSSS